MSSALHAEWTKLRTSPGTVWLLLGIVASTVAVSLLAVGAVSCPAADCGQDLTKISLTGVQLGQAVVAIVAVLAIGVEYSTGMIRLSLTAVPRRANVLLAKAVTVSVVVLIAAAGGVLGSLLAGRLVLAVSFSDGASVRAAAGSALYLVLIGLLSLGLAAIFRSSATAIGIVLALLYVFPILASAVSDPEWQRRLLQIGPMTAGLAIQSTRGLDDMPLSPWAGLGVLTLWAGGALLLGGLLLHKRDA